MTKNKTVSIIIPIYNAEITIEKCINSIISQSYSSIEIILVNDGSTDKSLEICNEYASNDNRIIVLNKENGGVSSARNAGVKCARGKYCCFVDSDDWIESDHIMNMVNEIEMTDCVIVGYYRETEQRNIICKLQPQIYHLKNMQDESICPLFVAGFIHPCWNKLFKTDIIKSNNITFNTNIHLSEDSLFLFGISNELQNNKNFRCSNISLL